MGILSSFFQRLNQLGSKPELFDDYGDDMYEDQALEDIDDAEEQEDDFDREEW